MTLLVDIRNLTRTFPHGDGEVRALDDVTLQIRQGEFVAIMGQSGSGKSTLMNIIGCLDRPTGGQCVIAGQDIATLDNDALARLRRETFGFIFQRYNLLPSATASENVQIPALYAGMERTTRRNRANALLTRLGLEQRSGHYPNQLSGGQQQRVAIARALVNHPPLILADEPTGALDSNSGAEVITLLKNLNKQGHTIVLITHDENIARNAQRIIRMQDGRIIADEPCAPSPALPVHTTQNTPRQNSHTSLLTSLGEAIRLALRSLHDNLYRTALTLLGIIIGVASVIVMMGVGTGSKQSVLDQINAFGTNLLFVRTGAPGIRSAGDIATLIPDDATVLQDIPNVVATTPGHSNRLTVRYGNIDYQTAVQGTGSNFPEVRQWPVQEGQFFTERDVTAHAPVVLLGQTVRNVLFAPDENPVGQFLLVKNVPMQIIGTLSAKGSNSFGIDQDDAVFTPYTTALVRLFGKTYLTDITVMLADETRTEETQEIIRQLLLKRHKVEDFNIRNMAALLATASAAQDTLTTLLGIVAAISLLVGGIGVMNIMLVSVTERTREIGIRMATGARQRDILLQFNTESVVVCATGGLLGVLLGYAAGFILHEWDVRIVFTLWPPVTAFLCACITGILFGYLPARKAARMEPVVALGAE